MRLIDHHILIDELPEILIGSYHIGEITALAGKHRQGAYHVVGLIARLLYDGYVISLGYLLDVGHSLANVLGSLLAASLIFGINLVAESAALRVEADGDMRRIFAFEQILQRIHKSKNRRRIEFLRSVARSANQCIVGTED